MSKRDWEEKEAFRNKPNYGTAIDGNAMAFPKHERVGDVEYGAGGLTIRQYFAGQIAAVEKPDDWPTVDDWAKHVWRAADALLRNA